MIELLAFNPCIEIEHTRLRNLGNQIIVHVAASNVCPQLSTNTRVRMEVSWQGRTLETRTLDFGDLGFNQTLSIQEVFGSGSRTYRVVNEGDLQYCSGNEICDGSLNLIFSR